MAESVSMALAELLRKADAEPDEVRRSYVQRIRRPAEHESAFAALPLECVGALL